MGDGSHDVAVLDEFPELGAVEDADARLRRSVRKQQRLEMELVDAVAPLRAGPVAVGALLAAAHPVGQAESAKNLHRARRDLVALDVRWLAGTAGLAHGHSDAARGKFHRQCQPDRAGTDNQYAGIE